MDMSEVHFHWISASELHFTDLTLELWSLAALVLLVPPEGASVLVTFTTSHTDGWQRWSFSFWQNTNQIFIKHCCYVEIDFLKYILANKVVQSVSIGLDIFIRFNYDSKHTISPTTIGKANFWQWLIIYSFFNLSKLGNWKTMYVKSR